MPDNKTPELPYDADNPAEQQLWDALGDVSAEEPSPRLRQEFYRKLAHASRPTIAMKLREWLGFSGNTGWLTATACVLLGLGAGQLFSPPGHDNGRLAALEENVLMLNRSLILDRLENDTASKRLRGVMDAAFIAGNDAEIATALLQRATQDRVPSVRSAAITALGTQVKTPEVGVRLMELLEQAESPLVQMALADLVLRNGSAEQMTRLQQLADNGSLHPDIARHVTTSLTREMI